MDMLLSVGICSTNEKYQTSNSKSSNRCLYDKEKLNQLCVYRNWQAAGPTHSTPLHPRSTLCLRGENTLGWWKWIWSLWGDVFWILISILVSAYLIVYLNLTCDVSQNLQSTNWQTMRFKPPPPNSDIGWRVEFRPMEVSTTYTIIQTEAYRCNQGLCSVICLIQNKNCLFSCIFAYFFQVQLTDFENAAYVVFVVLLTRVILSYKLDFLIPLSKVKTATQF